MFEGPSSVGLSALRPAKLSPRGLIQAARVCALHVPKAQRKTPTPTGRRGSNIAVVPASGNHEFGCVPD